MYKTHTITAIAILLTTSTSFANTQDSAEANDKKTPLTLAVSNSQSCSPFPQCATDYLRLLEMFKIHPKNQQDIKKNN